MTVTDENAKHVPQNYVEISTPEWAKDAVIYQINTRQFTEQGTFAAASQHLPRLRELGVDILWIMPIHPIGEKNRKGSLGSPYAVKDYFAVNPEFGDLASFQAFVDSAHSFGMKVILDWVANHSAWDNVLVETHPQWYEKDYKGDFTPTPWWDWDDIIDFDYQQQGLREYMAKAMSYWVETTNIDGYRCDVAGFVPNDFWSTVRRELDAIKPVFMLAEWESKDLHQRAFDMTYAWSWNEIMHGIAQQKLPIEKLFKYYSWNEKAFPREAHRMTFVSNHDKNAWDGTEFEQFGDCLHAAVILSVVGEGMPLIYNGQEAGNPKRLAFFEKDPIDWQPHPMGDFYAKLIALKKSQTCLYNGQWGARMRYIPNTCPEQIFSFVRQQSTSRVLVILNLSSSAVITQLNGHLHHGEYVDVFGNDKIVIEDNYKAELPAWGYQVLSSGVD